MTHGSLFSGIGGFDLAAEWMGWENVFHCEINEFCQKILKYHFPNSIAYADITKTDFTEWRGKVDIITGGFPCQPYSTAGKRKGKADDRHLWPEMLRAIREIQPTWVVGENVPGLLNWQRGMVLAEIKADLEASGFEVFPPVILPACSVDAPHKRYRLWIVAHSKKVDGEQSCKKKEHEQMERDSEHRRCFTQRWQDIAARVCILDDGISRRLDTKTISIKQWETKSLEAAGNAIVPQVAYEIFKTIEQFEELQNKNP